MKLKINLELVRMSVDNIKCRQSNMYSLYVFLKCDELGVFKVKSL